MNGFSIKDKNNQFVPGGVCIFIIRYKAQLALAAGDHRVTENTVANFLGA